MINTAIFDMDGLLIDSEPLWKEAEAKIFGVHGVSITSELSNITMAMTTKEVVDFWFSRYPKISAGKDELENAVVTRVGELILSKGKIKSGVMRLLDILCKLNFKIGLATNSPKILIPIVTQKLGIAHYFDVVTSADEVTRGKPSPEIYIKTLEKLNAEACRTIAFEDSESGMLSAKAAQLFTCVVPNEKEYEDSKFDVAHLKLCSLKHFDTKILAQISTN